MRARYIVCRSIRIYNHTTRHSAATFSSSLPHSVSLSSLQPDTGTCLCHSLNQRGRVFSSTQFLVGHTQVCFVGIQTRALGFENIWYVFRVRSLRPLTGVCGGKSGGTPELVIRQHSVRFLRLGYGRSTQVRKENGPPPPVLPNLRRALANASTPPPKPRGGTLSLPLASATFPAPRKAGKGRGGLSEAVCETCTRRWRRP